MCILITQNVQFYNMERGRFVRDIKNIYAVIYIIDP